MLLSALRRSTNKHALRVVTHVNRSRLAPSTVAMQQRTFLTSPRVTSYVMARAKVLHLAARSFLAYNQIITLDSASSPLSRYFTRNATLRERVHMYLVCLIPPDQPIDLPDFLDGARQAAHVVFTQLYGDKWNHNMVKEAALVDVASDQCVEKWTDKLEAQRQALQLPVGTTFTLEKLEVSDVRLAEAEYEYSDAAMDQKNDTCSMYHMNEAVCLKVRYNVVEHLLASRNDREDHPTRYTLRSTFDWSFYSDVSRAQFVDWRITESTPFKLEMVTDNRAVKTKTPAAI